MKKFVIALALLTVMGAAHAATPVVAPKSDAAKIAPAAKVMDAKELATAVASVMPLDQQITEFSDSLATHVEESKRPLFKSIVKKNIDAAKLRATAIDALQKTYTEAELKAMYDFYSKPEAKEIMRKLPQFSSVMQPAIEGMARNALEEARKANLLPPPPAQ